MGPSPQMWRQCPPELQDSHYEVLPRPCGQTPAPGTWPAGQAGGERDASWRVDGSPFSAHRPLAWLLLCVPLGGWRVSSTVKGSTGKACSDYVPDSSREDTTGGRVVPHFMSVQKRFQMVGLTCPENESSCLFSCTLLVRLYCGQHQQSTTSESVGTGIHR